MIAWKSARLHGQFSGRQHANIYIYIRINRIRSYFYALEAEYIGLSRITTRYFYWITSPWFHLSLGHQAPPKSENLVEGGEFFRLKIHFVFLLWKGHLNGKRMGFWMIGFFWSIFFVVLNFWDAGDFQWMARNSWHAWEWLDDWNDWLPVAKWWRKIYVAKLLLHFQPSLPCV